MARKRVNPDAFYFSDRENQAVIEFINAKPGPERERIYNEKLHEPMSKLVSSLIRRYELYIPGEDFEDTFADALSDIYMKMGSYKPERGTKAYSYYGTVVKHYLLGRIDEANKLQNRFVRLETEYDDFNEDNECEHDYLVDETSEVTGRKLQYDAFITSLQKAIRHEMETNQKLSKDDIRVGEGLIFILNYWDNFLEELKKNKEVESEHCDDSQKELNERITNKGNPTDSIELFTGVESNKYTKATMLYVLREYTLLDTPKIHKALMKYKKVYERLKEIAIE